MRRVILVILGLQVSLLWAVEINNKEVNNNDVSPPTPNLETNLRDALLKALKELENEENQSSDYNDKEKNKTIERASASAVSVVTKDDVVIVPSTTSSVTESVSTTEKPIVLLQKSEGEHRLTISTFEKDTDSENFLTSASSSFALSKQQPEKSSQNQKSISSSLNLIGGENKFSTSRPIDTTTTPTTTSTEESEAKVENVQFFSAPLVAAFTVHQDELGLPNKVESIFKPGSTVNPKDNLRFDGQNLQEQRNQQLSLQQRQNFNPNAENFKNNQNDDEVRNLRLQQQLVLQQKQKALEEEVLRLKQQQQIALQQQLSIQQQNFFLQQEQQRLRAKQVIPNSPLQPSLNVGESIFGTVQQLPTKEAQLFNGLVKPSPNTISLQPSISFEPLSDAGKLPFNGQFLPIKEAVNFHSSPIIQRGFQQFSPTSPPFASLVQPPTFQQQPLFSNNGHGNRFSRQEAGVGNFINRGFNKPSSSFTIQKSIQPPQTAESNTFKLNTGSKHIEPLRNEFFAPNSYRINSFSETIPQNRNRFFRSNPESNFNSPSQFYNTRQNNDKLGNLLFNSGALRGKSQEDVNLISKVLSLNHLGSNSFRPLIRQF